MKQDTGKQHLASNELAALVAQAKAGDQNAFTELYDRTAPELYRCIRAMTRDEELAWDIQQDAYLHAFRHLDRLENDAVFFPWLRRIAVNATASQLRKRIPIPFTELASDEYEALPELPDLSMDNQPELSLDRKESARLMQEILSGLPESQQLIVGMRYYDELSVKEIAEALHLSVGTVKAQLFNGRKKIECAVRGLERQGVRLYGLSPLPFLLALMRNAEPLQPARQAVVRAIVTASVAGAATEAVAVSASSVTAMTFGQMLKGSIAKIAIGVLSVAAIGGGIWAGSKLLKNDQTVAPYQPSETLEAVLLEHGNSNDTLEDLIDPIAYTLPDETDRATATEPQTSTEPSTNPPVSTEATDRATATEPQASTEPSTNPPVSTEATEAQTIALETKTVSLTLRFMETEDYFSFHDLEQSANLSLDVPADWTKDGGVFRLSKEGDDMKVLEPVCLLQEMDDTHWDKLVQFEPPEQHGDLEYLSTVSGVDANGRDYVLLYCECPNERFIWYPCEIFLRDTSGIVVHMVYYMPDPEDPSANTEIHRIIDSIRVE